MGIEVANESGYEVDELALVDLARHVLDAQGVHPLAELSVLLVDESAMERLHVQWMDEPGPTDVMAFPMDELSSKGSASAHRDDDEPPPTLLGDVVLCPSVARRQAEQAGHSFDDEIQVLCAHGVLHLLGYDHGDPEEEREMFALQAELLQSWAVARGSAPFSTSALPRGGESSA